VHGEFQIQAAIGFETNDCSVTGEHRIHGGALDGTSPRALSVNDLNPFPVCDDYALHD
jgi:hypothetical protein